MRNAILFAIVFPVSGCVSHIQEDEIDISAVSKAMQMLYQICVEQGDSFGGEVTYPEPIGRKESFCRADGAYIRLNSFFVTESGLYRPKPHIAVSLDSRSDPSFKQLGGGVYSYLIRG